MVPEYKEEDTRPWDHKATRSPWKAGSAEEALPVKQGMELLECDSTHRKHPDSLQWDPGLLIPYKKTG